MFAAYPLQDFSSMSSITDTRLFLPQTATIFPVVASYDMLEEVLGLLFLPGP